MIVFCLPIVHTEIVIITITITNSILKDLRKFEDL